MSRLLAELSGPAAGAILTEDSILVLPLGATEHHGPHLPLTTDALVADAVSTAAVQRAVDIGLDVWQLPTLSITKSDEHSWAPGTLWLTPETLLSTLVDIGRSITQTPARTLVFLNAHGGNVALLNVALRELRRRFGLRTFFVPAVNAHAPSSGEGLPGELGLGIHAGYTETSIVMHLRPDLVDETLFERNVPEHIAGFAHLGFKGKQATFGWLSNDFGPGGVVGDPTGASAESGARLFASSVEFVVETLEEISRFDYLAPRTRPEP